ncbi:MAG: penicillin-binding protein 2 [Actinomycetota bacterium]|nr:penicillin-binding protein 2 [Actinomycetota bacterium]
MNAAIRAAVITLLVMAAIIVVGVIVKAVYDSRKGLRLSSSRRQMKEARTLPSPVRQKGANATPDVGAGVRGSEKIHTRLVALKVIVTAVLGTLFVKLWSMQILSGRSWRAASEDNRTTTYSTASPRGRILDRNGKVLAGSRGQLVVTGNADAVSDRALIHRLSNLLGLPRPAIKQALADTSGGAQAARVVATDVPMRVVAFISEHPALFPGINVETRTQRVYPYGTIGAHVIGYTGAISEEELKEGRTADGEAYAPDDIVGKSGAELAFESVLQGMHGTRTVEVDASGNVISTIGETQGRKGNDVQLCIDIDAQKIADDTLSTVIELAKASGSNANAGACVALDLSDGGVCVMSSYPTFDPNQFVNGISSETWDELNTEESAYPLTNRVIQGLYPAASTFKGYASVAGLEEGYIDEGTISNCTGTWTALGDDWPKKCWLLSGHGEIAVVEALVQSCDVFFYDLSLKFYQNRNRAPNALQDDVMKFGLGALTGIDLANEAEGRIPTAAWKANYFKDDPNSSQWQPGDMANLIIGQGDVLITPIQNAVGYAALATGRSYRPHVLGSVLNENGDKVVSAKVEVLHEPKVQESTYRIVREGLHLQTKAHNQFDNCPFEAAGKSGTGEVNGKDDMSWYVGYAPADNPQYVAACCVEEMGGQGGNLTAGVVRAVLASLLGLEDNGNTNITRYVSISTD